MAPKAITKAATTKNCCICCKLFDKLYIYCLTVYDITACALAVKVTRYFVRLRCQQSRKRLYIYNIIFDIFLRRFSMEDVSPEDLCEAIRRQRELYDEVLAQGRLPTADITSVMDWEEFQCVCGCGMRVTSTKVVCPECKRIFSSNCTTKRKDVSYIINN